MAGNKMERNLVEHLKSLAAASGALDRRDLSEAARVLLADLAHEAVEAADELERLREKVALYEKFSADEECPSCKALGESQDENRALGEKLEKLEQGIRAGDWHEHDAPREIDAAPASVPEKREGRSDGEG